MFDTYAGLQTTVARWVHRTDLDMDVPDFIRLAELDINRRLKVVAKEVEAPLACEVGARFVPLPSDFGAPIALWLTDVDPRRTVTARLPEQLMVDESLSTRPHYWAIDGRNLAFDCRPDQAYPLQLRYLQTLFLSDVAPTNDLFASAPDLYLYGALVHSAPFCQDDARMPMWQAKYESLLRSVAMDGTRAKALVQLQTEIPAALCGSRSQRHWSCS